MASHRLLTFLASTALAGAVRSTPLIAEFTRPDLSRAQEGASLSELNITHAFAHPLRGVHAAAFLLLSLKDIVPQQNPWTRFVGERWRVKAKPWTHVDGKEDWDKLGEQSEVSASSLEDVVRDPKVAQEMVEALMGVLLARTEIQAQCESTWLGHAAHWIGTSFSGKTRALIDHSISVVKAEVATAISESVEAVKRAADLILVVILSDVCRLLALSSEPVREKEADECREASADGLHALLERLETPSPASGYRSVPSRMVVEWRVYRSKETRQLAMRIAEFASVLLSINMGAEYTENTAITGDLSAVRDKVWKCGQLTDAEKACSSPYLVVEVPPSSGGKAEKRYAVQVLGSPFATALLLYWADEAAYPEDYDRSSLHPAAWVGTGKTENPNRRGYPGGLGRLAGETDRVKLQQRLLYWDPTVGGIQQWAAELCAHAKARRGAHDCQELFNMLLDLQSALMLATALQGTVSLVVAGGAGNAAAAAAAISLQAGGAGAGMTSAVNFALASAGVPGAAPIVLTALAASTLIGGAVWLVWRGSSSGAGALSSEDCLCSLLSTVSRPRTAAGGGQAGAREITPTPSEVGLGYSLCTSGLGACPTHSVMRARQDSDTLFVSLSELLRREGCGAIEECAAAARDAWCRLEDKLIHTEAFCAENSDCSGEFDTPEQGDGRPVFAGLCEEFAKEKAVTMRQKVHVMMEDAKLSYVCSE